MKVDRKLNVVFPIENGWIHATPVGYSVFEKYFLPLSKTFSALYREGLGAMTGPRVAYLMLKKISMDGGLWDGDDGIENGFMNEVIRLANVVRPSEDNTGFALLPLYNAIQQGVFTEDEQSEVLNTLVFFTLASLIHKKSELAAILAGMTRFWGGEITLSTVTAFVTSLATPTPDVTTGVTATASSVPS